MSILDMRLKLPRLRRQRADEVGEKALTISPSVLEAFQSGYLNPYARLGGTNNLQITTAYERGQSSSYGWLYSYQPAVRSVVDFIARNVSQLPLKLYEYVDIDEKEEQPDHPAAQVMRNPDDKTPPDQFIFKVLLDFLIYDNAYMIKFPPRDGNRILLKRVQPERVTVTGGFFDPIIYRVWKEDGSFLPVPPEAMIHWKGYNPLDPLIGFSKLETVRQELATEMALQKTISELAKVGLRSGYITRPLEAPEMSEKAIERFREQWENQKATGRTPFLEEGMEFKQQSISPEDAEVLATRKYTLEEVARMYGVPLEALAGAADARKAVYADVLPPYTRSLASTLDVGLLRQEYGVNDYCFEFDLNEKMRGDVEARWAAMTSAAGRPWQTVNEVRTMDGKPPVKDGDELALPANIGLTGQGNPNTPFPPAPNVMPPQQPEKPPQDGSHREQPKQIESGRKQLEAGADARVTDVLLRLYERQQSSVVAGKFDDQRDRFQRELANDLTTIFGADGELADEKAGELIDAVGKMLARVDQRKVFQRARDSAPEMAAVIVRAFDPHQPRDPHTGEWITIPGGGGSSKPKPEPRLSLYQNLANDIRSAKDEHTQRRLARKALTQASFDIQDSLASLPPPRKGEDLADWLASVIKLIHDALERVNLRLAATFLQQHGDLEEKLLHYGEHRGPELADDVDSMDALVHFVGIHGDEIAKGMVEGVSSAIGVHASDVAELKDLNVPDEVLWERAGFSKEEVDRMIQIRNTEALLDASFKAVADDN